MLLMPPSELRDIINVLREKQLLSRCRGRTGKEAPSGRVPVQESKLTFIHDPAGMWLICCDESKPVHPP